MKLGRLLLIGRFKKRKRRRKEIREFSFLKTNLGIEGEIFFFREQHALEDSLREKSTDEAGKD